MPKFKFVDKESIVYEWVDGGWLDMGNYVSYGITHHMSDAHKAIIVNRVLYQE